MLYYLIALIVIIIDQFTKFLIVKYMEIGESIPVIEKLFYISSHRNAGAAFGILQGQMIFFYIITVIVIGIIVYYIQTQTKESRFLGISLGLILGGAIGNFIDRVLLGHVVDFLNVYIFSYDFPIFNIADSALVIGVLLLIVFIFLEEKKQRKS